MSFSFQMKIIIAIVIINIYFLYIYLLFYDCLVSLIVILQLSIHDYSRSQIISTKLWRIQSILKRVIGCVKRRQIMRLNALQALQNNYHCFFVFFPFILNVRQHTVSTAQNVNSHAEMVFVLYHWFLWVEPDVASFNWSR